MGLIYTFTYFTTDQYAPSLPEMSLQLGSPQQLMSASIQMNFVVKAIAGIFAAGLSDRIGRRPVMLFCLSMLSWASLCCALANLIEWFLAGRLLQGIGEAVEPMVLASVRDYFPDSEKRFSIIAMLQMMSITGQLVAPVFGGYTAQLFSWRFSFLLLSLLWAFMAVYAALRGVESCPTNEEGDLEDYWANWSKLMDSHILSLLLTECCNMAAYMVFCTNVSFLVEENYGKSTMICSTVMLAYCAQNATGLFLMERLPLRGVLTKAKISVSMYALSGVILSIFGALLHQHFWAYCVGVFLLAWPSISMLVSVNVLYFEAMKDCAGFAASLEILAKSVPSAIYSVWSTQSLIHAGARGVMEFQGLAAVASGFAFWAFAVAPPTWALNLEDAEEARMKDPKAC
eukprot:Skav226480  [mRNA]  locus=scaffold4441:87514:88713:- [translate_table: standard]